MSVVIYLRLLNIFSRSRTTVELNIEVFMLVSPHF